MRDEMTITDRKAAAVFSAPMPARIVQTLIARELTLSALASAVKMPMSLLHHHVSKCMALGLIEIVREQPRTGRAVKYYRATARAFFVPSDLINTMPGAAMTKQLRDALDQHQATSVEGIRYSHDGRSPRGHLVKSAASQLAAIELWLDAGLKSTDAAELMRDLQALMDSYRKRSKPDEPRYLVHVAAVRKPA